MNVRTPSEVFYSVAAIRMRTGATEYSRFHGDVNPATLDERGQAGIVVRLLDDKGLKPCDVANDGDPVASFAVWGNDADCRRVYDELIASSGAKPDSYRKVGTTARQQAIPRGANYREHMLHVGARLLRVENENPDHVEDDRRQLRDELVRAMAHVTADEGLPPLLDAEQKATLEGLLIENEMALAWARCGFPRVQFRNHSVAAEMMHTQTRPEMLLELQSPWPCFWIDLPTNMIRIPDSRGELVEITNLFVCFGASGVRFAFGNAVDLVGNWWVPSLTECGNFTSRGPGERVLAALMVSICIDFTVRRPAPARRRAPPRRPGIARNGAPPDTVDYVIVERAVAIAAPTPGRELATGDQIVRVVRDYVRGVPSARRLHRGHFQMQTCGPNSTERRLQYHRPYWQGPRDAPMAVRPHERR